MPEDSAHSLEDIEIQEDRDIEIDDTNDLKIVTGNEDIRQSTYIDAANVIRPYVGERLSASIAEDIRADLRDALLSDPQIDQVIEISVTDVNRDENTLEFEITTEPLGTFTVPADLSI